MGLRLIIFENIHLKIHQATIWLAKSYSLDNYYSCKHVSPCPEKATRYVELLNVTYMHKYSNFLKLTPNSNNVLSSYLMTVFK